MKLAKISMVALAFSLTASMAFAQPGGGGGPGGFGGGMGRGGRGGGLMQLAQPDQLKRITDAIDKLTLTDDQKTKIADLKKEYEPKVKDARDKMVDVLTDDQKTKLKDVQKDMAAATDQQGRMDAMQKMRDSITLSDDQTTKMTDLGPKLTTLIQEARTKFRDVLTDAQKTEFDTAVPAGRGGARGTRGGNRGGRGGNRGGGGAGGAGAAPQAT